MSAQIRGESRRTLQMNHQSHQDYFFFTRLCSIILPQLRVSDPNIRRRWAGGQTPTLKNVVIQKAERFEPSVQHYGTIGKFALLGAVGAKPRGGLPQIHSACASAYQDHSAPKWVSYMYIVMFTLMCICATTIADGFQPQTCAGAWCGMS